MTKILFMMLAGGIGALARYSVSSLIQNHTGLSFPVGTITVNVLGCFLFGFIWTIVNERYFISGEVAFIVLTGFVGSFTTFSTMTFDAFQLFRTSALSLGLAYLLLTQLSGLVFTWVGVSLGRLI